jgi:hypothetical protein
MTRFVLNATRKQGRWSPKEGKHKALPIKTELEVFVLMQTVSSCG